MTDWKRSGARSRSRGRTFEKDVARRLGWSRVAMSGANAEYGEGDVIDGFVNGPGYWVAECKMRTAAGGVTVEGKWIDQSEKACERSGRVPVIIVGIKSDHRKPRGWVFLGSEAARFLHDRLAHSDESSVPSWAKEEGKIGHVVMRTAARSGGFTVRQSVIQQMEDNGWVAISLGVQAGDKDSHWMMMPLDAFAEIIRGVKDACVAGPHFYDEEDG